SELILLSDARMPTCSCRLLLFLFSFTDPAPTAIYTLSLHDALPICHAAPRVCPSTRGGRPRRGSARGGTAAPAHPGTRWHRVRSDRKSTRLNSSHVSISYAVFCLKKKKKHTL